MADQQHEKKFFSRRSLVKVGASLFAFVPAAQYLAMAPIAHAYVICSDVECYVEETDCADYDCTGTNELYWVWWCYDVRDGEFCGIQFTNIGILC